MLVQPAPFEHGRLGLENVLWLSEPAALTTLAAMVLPEHDVRIIDMRLERDDALPRVIADFKPRLVGITSMTTDAYQARAVAYCAKSILGPEVFTLIGGHHPTLAPEEHDVECIDAICIGEGEETFSDLVRHLDGGGAHDQLDGIDGLVFRRAGTQVRTAPRAQSRALDTFPAPARDLLNGYRRHYFFGAALNMASMQTSRGCAYDCNFCAIWEFYDRKVRFLSPQAICDRLEAMTEKFVMFLDDNFLTHRPRLEQFLDELERRRIRKYWMIQGRSDFIARNPDILRRMRDLGLCMVLSGYESNDDDALAALRKDNTRANNIAAARILNALGILATGVFMVRPDFDSGDFDALYATINEMPMLVPLVVIHTPLPGTQNHRRFRERLLTRDARLYDLMHAVVPTKLPRREFYAHYARWNKATWPAVKNALTLRFLLQRPGLRWELLKGLVLFARRRESLRRVIEDPQTYLRDETDLIDADAPAAWRAEEVA